MTPQIISRMIRALRHVQDVRNPVERANAYEAAGIPSEAVPANDAEALETVLRIREINQSQSGKVKYNEKN